MPSRAPAEARRRLAERLQACMTMIDAIHSRPTITANDGPAADADADAGAIGMIFAGGH